jgi:lipoyl(octanoyl) transferase
LPVLELQERLVASRSEGAIPDTVLLLEHEPVVTLGRGARAENVLLHEDALRARGWDRVETSRGGDVTLHAPGQLVGYPIFDLRPDRCDVRRYVKDLAETMRLVASHYGVASGELSGLVGLWADEERPAIWDAAAPPRRAAKLGAIGVHISRWVTSHGFALNLSTSADLFSLIVPCGIRDHGVTSISALTGRGPSAREAAETALHALGRVFSATAGELTDAEGLPLERALPRRSQRLCLRGSFRPAPC